MIRGRCLCGGVEYAATGPPHGMWHCHCSRCRRASGAPFATWLAVDREGLRIVETAPVRRFDERLGRTFCGGCGSVLPRPGPDPEQMLLPAGGLDDDPGVRASAHLFTASKASWYSIPDALPRHAAEAGTPPPGPAVPDEETTPRSAVRGGCLCGAFTFEVESGADTIKACHCSRDRKVTGAAHDACMSTRASAVRVLTEGTYRRYKVPGSTRFEPWFCVVCGGFAVAAEALEAAGSGSICIPGGALDGDPGARLRYHIFYGSRAPWFSAEDALPRFEQYPPRDFDWRRRAATG